MTKQYQMIGRLLISGLSKQDFEEFRNQTTFSSKLTLEDIKEFFKNSGVSIYDIQICKSDYQIPTIVFKYHTQRYIFFYCDTRIAIQDAPQNVYEAEHYHDWSLIYTLAPILQDSWFEFMYKKFDYAYILTYPMHTKKTLQSSKYISKVDDSEFKEWIISFICNLEQKTNSFYHAKKEALTIREIQSAHNDVRRFVITRLNGDIFYICFSDFEITYPDLKRTKFFTFMYKQFGLDYLKDLREHAIDRLNQVEVPKYIEKCTKKIDKTINMIENSSKNDEEFDS